MLIFNILDLFHNFSVQTFIIFVQINKHLSAPKKNIAESVKGKKEYPFLLKENKKRMSSHEFTLEE